ncbi:uncharacterized protein LOC143590095 [Bidens hawaiensis]|uniref:uncharacterized protein LOC143590095 n=1 Tax=Bidens hawaiensis TaxID=980011 RepID=UPI0040492EED
MTGIPREISEHRLRVNPAYTPIVQKRRKMGPEHTKAMNEQVQDLLHAFIIREIQYKTWVANPMMVPKSNGSWRMCIDFKDFNRACPKDCYPLPEIDLKVDAVAPFKYKCFLDAYKGYHQIWMAAGDEDKTAFHAETRYSMLEKLVLALVYAARRLKMYFQGHPIHVLTDYKLKNVLTKPELSGRLAKLTIELCEHSIEYKARPAIKGQVWADFFMEVPTCKVQECLVEQQPPIPSDESQHWTLFMDGTSSGEGSGAGLKLINSDAQEFTYAIKLNFKSTNNEAEYEAFLAGLRIARKLGVKFLEARVDSLLIAGQVSGTYDEKNDVMASYLSQAKDLMQQFASCNVDHIKRSENRPADALSKLASTSFEHMGRDVRIEVLDTLSVPQLQVLVIQTGATSWMEPIKTYLSSGALPEDKAEA